MEEEENSSPTIRWRKGELIGCGAYGSVYMGMNLDSGGLLAVKQVLIAANNGSKEKAQEHIRALEVEINLLRNLSHRNIVRYLGTTREEHTLNILLEFVPGGSISSLLGKFGPFSESVIRVYTKQLLQGLEYLHVNDIMHRDIKGANILVSNKGCIKLADFGASKQLLELEAVTGAKSVKGTPYWMAPEVIRRTGHGLSADIWSVGCTVIEMATGKPPWGQQFEEVAAFYNIGKSKSHPPIPDHLSSEAKDFLLKCLNREPNLRPTASELLQHPFVVGDHKEVHPLVRPAALGEYDSNNENDYDRDYYVHNREKDGLKPSASELLQHPFVVGDQRELHPLRPSALGECDNNYEKDDESEYNSESSSDSNVYSTVRSATAMCQGQEPKHPISPSARDTNVSILETTKASQRLEVPPLRASNESHQNGDEVISLIPPTPVTSTATAMFQVPSGFAQKTTEATMLLTIVFIVSKCVVLVATLSLFIYFLYNFFTMFNNFNNLKF